MACVKRKWFLLTKYNVKYSSITTIAIIAIVESVFIVAGPSLHSGINFHEHHSGTTAKRRRVQDSDGSEE